MHVDRQIIKTDPLRGLKICKTAVVKARQNQNGVILVTRPTPFSGTLIKLDFHGGEF